MAEISELLPPLPKPVRFDYDHGADMGTPVYSEAQMRKYALDAIRRADARQAPADYSNLLSVITDIRERSGVGSKPMLSELADAIAERIAEPKVGDEIQFCPQCGWNSAMDATPVPLPAGTVTQFRDEYAWACACLNGNPYPFIHENSVRTNRADAQACLGEAWQRDGETLAQGWKRAYRQGWRCIRVRISHALSEPHHAE